MAVHKFILSIGLHPQITIYKFFSIRQRLHVFATGLYGILYIYILAEVPGVAREKKMLNKTF